MMNAQLDPIRATENLPIGEPFANLLTLKKVEVIAQVIERLLDQLDEQDRWASLHEWQCLQEAIQWLQLCGADGLQDVLERALEACMDGEPLQPSGGPPARLRQSLHEATKARREQFQV
ncbi:hypothetical protein [Ralstonia sp. 24A2]|uniref:hypothetical protein n=1 Tax=Ralstonia sp. 24A2 TaxID=3447364 RepID=UPI003F6A2F6E